jgi:pilus assembly protein CpaB
MSFLKNRTVIGVICILFSLLICFGITPLFNAGIAHKVSIVRVAKDITAGEQITKDMVQTVQVGGYNLPNNVLKTESSVVGKYAVSDLDSGDYILSSKLSAEPAGSAYLSNLDGKKQAVSVTVKTLADGLSGKLQPGDIVSVIAPDFRKQGTTVIPGELQYVEVIAVTTSSGGNAGAGNTASQANQSSGNESNLPSTVTLLASPEQSKLLAELDADDDIHLALVYRGTEANVSKFIEAQDKVLAGLYPSDSTGSEDSASTGGASSSSSTSGTSANGAD